MLDLPVLHSKRVMLEIALYLEGSGDTVEDLISRNQISADELQKLLSNPIFRTDLSRMREEVREKGLTFRVKARAMAEELLKSTWLLTQDNNVSPTVRADLIKAVVEWGDLKPKNKESAQDMGGGIKILINLGSTAPPLLVEGTQVTLPYTHEAPGRAE